MTHEMEHKRIWLTTFDFALRFSQSLYYRVMQLILNAFIFYVASLE